MRTNKELNVYGLDLYGRDVLTRLDAVADALASVDLGDLSDAAIEESLSVLSVVLGRVDLVLIRLMSERRFRGMTADEFPWFGDEAAWPVQTMGAEAASDTHERVWPLAS